MWLYSCQQEKRNIWSIYEFHQCCLLYRWCSKKKEFLYVNKQKNVMKNRFNGLRPFMFHTRLLCLFFSLPVKSKFQNRKPKHKQIKRRRGSLTEALKRHSGVCNVYTSKTFWFYEIINVKGKYFSRSHHYKNSPWVFLI